jgi:predicted N-acetyltransferase YhbS
MASRKTPAPTSNLDGGAWTIRAERPEDAPLVDALNAASFGPGRFARAAFRLREGVHPEAGLSFVAVEGAELRGSVRFWPVRIGETPALMLGPLAVQSDQRGRGIGIALMERGLSEAKTLGHKFAILVGDLPYYARAGFKQVAFAPRKEDEGKKTPPSSRVRFPGPVDPLRVLAIALDDSASVDQLEGDVKRARIDDAVCADGAALG